MAAVKATIGGSKHEGQCSQTSGRGGYLVGIGPTLVGCEGNHVVERSRFHSWA